jgi:hypothetical protein
LLDRQLHRACGRDDLSRAAGQPERDCERSREQRDSEQKGPFGGADEAGRMTVSRTEQGEEDGAETGHPE